MKYNTHHILYREADGPTPYDDNECLSCGHIRQEDWTVDIPAILHQHINIIQRWKTTPERYALLTAYMHAICHEWNRMRRELDQAWDDGEI